MVIGAETVIPTEMVIPIAGTRIQTLEGNSQDMTHDLDTIDEIRDTARLKIADYQQRLTKAYNKKHMDSKISSRWLNTKESIP